MSIESVWSHKLLRLIDGRAGGTSLDKTTGIHRAQQRIVFYERFLEDPDCTPIMKKVLKWQIGLLYSQLKEKPGCFEDFEQRRFLIERWQEICH